MGSEFVCETKLFDPSDLWWSGRAGWPKSGLASQNHSDTPTLSTNKIFKILVATCWQVLESQAPEARVVRKKLHGFCAPTLPKIF